MHGDLRSGGEGDDIKPERLRERLQGRRGARRDEERTGGECCAAGGEGVFRDLDGDVFEAVAQRNEVGRAVIGHGVDGGCRQVLQSAFGREVIHRIDGHILHGFVRGGLDVGVGHQAHGPRAVVVGVEIGIGIDLLAEQRFRKRAVGLVGFDNEGARRVIAVAQFDGSFRATHLNALHAQDVNHKSDAGEVLLIRGNDETVGRFFRAGGESVTGLDIEVLQDDLRKRGDKLERGEDSGFGEVGVVAHRPEDGFVGRIGAIPLAFGHVAESAAATEQGGIRL